MATHSSVLAWRIPGTGEPGGLCLWGHTESDTTEVTKQQQQRSYPTLKVKKGSGEEIPLVQGKEQHLHFAGAAVKRYTTPKVRETQVRQ